MTPARWAYLAIGIFVAGIVLSFCSRRNGIEIGAQDQRIQTAATDVKELKLEKVIVDQVAEKEVAKSDRIRPERRAARAKVEIRGDTVIADEQTIVLPSVASLIRVDDRQGAQDSTSIHAQARSDTLANKLIAGLDVHVDLLEEAKRPRCSRKCGIAIGVVGTVGVVYVVVKVVAAIRH